MLWAASNPSNRPPVYTPHYLDYGYFGGGQVSAPSFNTGIDRTDYSNDTATAVAKGSLSSSRSMLAGTGNSSYGYIGGGFIVSFPVVYRSTIDRIDYSNDTATAVAKGPLSLARAAAAATGTSVYGYFGGGDSPSTRSTVDRLDYSNDTATAVAKGPLSAARSELAATGTSAYGYFGSGHGGAYTPNYSTVARIDYANDTATAVAKGPLSGSTRGRSATGNSSYGYFAGGVNSTRVGRIDYANDTATATVKGPLTLNRFGLSASGTASYGYFVGGRTFSPAAVRSTIDRIDYANDTATTVAKGPLSATRYRMGGVQNCPL